MSNDGKDAKKKRKEERKRKREEYQNKLSAIKLTDVKARNEMIEEIVTVHLGKNMSVFEARRSKEQCLSNDIFSNTPLFWYKKHKWGNKDVKEFFRICGVKKDKLDQELAVIWGTDESAKKRKTEKRKKLKEKHLRKESFASLLTLRHSSLRLMQERSMQFVRSNDPKAEKASVKIWNLLIKSFGGSEEKCPELNHTKFNIGLNDCDIQCDPDMSVSIFYELITTYEIIEEHRQNKKKESKKSSYKKSKVNMGGGILGGGGALKSSAYFANVAIGNKNKNKKRLLNELDKAEDNEVNKIKGDEGDVVQSVKIKHIKKKSINRQYVKRMLRHINKNIKREHTICSPKKLKMNKLYLVVTGKIFDAIQNGQKFDVQNDYISQALTGEQLNNPSELLEIISSRSAEWKQRVQVLEYIEANLDSNDALSPLCNDEESFLSLIVGWTGQLYDERSRITQTAAELFPSLLTILLSKMSTPAIIFEKENLSLENILSGLFTLLKNKRAKSLAEIAHDVLIETINILSTVAADLDPSAYYTLMKILCDHTNSKIEKHEKVRAGCAAYSLFVIYGTEATEVNNQKQLTLDSINQHEHSLHPMTTMTKSISATSNDSENALNISPTPSPNVSGDEGQGDDKEQKEGQQQQQQKEKKNVKIAKKAQRKFLFDDEEVMKLFAEIISNGVQDKSKEAREKSMKALKKLEVNYMDILEKYIDKQCMIKYEKWKKFNKPKTKGKKKKRQRIKLTKHKTVPPSIAKKTMLEKNGKGAKSVDSQNDNNE